LARLRPLTREEYRLIEAFASSLGVGMGAVAANPLALVVPGARYFDVFDAPLTVLKSLGAAGESLYAAGFYLGYIEGYSFTPSLPLGQRMSRLCGHSIDCIVLDGEGERFFLYGRRVYGDHVVEWLPGFRLVVNTEGEFLGWGNGVSAEKGGVSFKIVEPVKDLGWYLRRGG
jgi:60S ribosome subunit biogenesis protein NIP7